MKLERILIFKIGHLGDTLVALPAFWAIREQYPDARLTLLANLYKENENYLTALDVLPEQGLIDETITYPHKALRPANINQYLKLMLNIKRARFDCLIYLMTRNRTAAQINRDRFFFKLCGIGKIIGIDYLERNLLDYQSLRPLPKVETETNFLLRSVYESDLFEKKIGGKNVVPKTDLLLTDVETGFAERWIRENCFDLMGKKMVAVAPGSKWASKLWGIERFARVIDQLIEKYQIFPIVFGGPEDREIGDRLIAGWRRGANAAGLLKVRESAAVLRKCDLYLGNDTGTMHLAASVGVRCVAVFSAVDYPNRWHPFGNGHQLFRQQVSCEGCHSPISFNNSLCMTLTTVNEVYQGCEKILFAA